MFLFGTHIRIAIFQYNIYVSKLVTFLLSKKKSERPVNSMAMKIKIVRPWNECQKCAGFF
jgi:hypothetical protein